MSKLSEKSAGASVGKSGRPVLPKVELPKMGRDVVRSLRDEVAAGALEPTPVAATRGRILVVDDSSDILLLVELTLKRAGFQVETLAHATRALERIEVVPFDALVLDVSMPEISGLELTRLIRASERTRELPILMLSAHGEAADRVRGLREGADDYLTKPFDPEELVLRIERLVAAHIPPGGLAGDLATYPLWEVMQTLERARATGTIAIAGASGESGELRMASGRLVHAQMAGLEGEEAALSILSISRGAFRFREGEAAAVEKARTLEISALVMTAAWLEDELATRRHRVPDLDRPLALADGASVELPGSWSPGVERVLGAVASGGVTRRQLLERGIASAQTVDLTLAWLVELGALEDGGGETSGLRELARCTATIERLRAAAGLFDGTDFEVLLVASPSAWHRFIALLGSWKAPGESWWERLEEIARTRSGSLGLGGCGLELHLLSLDATSATRATNALARCQAAAAWWAPDDDPAPLASVIAASRALPDFSRGLLVPIENGDAAPPVDVESAGERWHGSPESIQNLSALLERLL